MGIIWANSKCRTCGKYHFGRRLPRTLCSQNEPEEQLSTTAPDFCNLGERFSIDKLVCWECMKTKPIDAILAAFPGSEPQFIYRVVCEKSRVDLSFDKESFANANGLQDLLAKDKAIAQCKSKQEQDAMKQIKLAVIGVVIAVIVYLFLLFMK